MIHLKNLEFKYGKRKNLFENLDLQLTAGNIYGLLGKNGAGKTTLLRLINGLLFPVKGTVDVMGFDATDRHPDMLADICYVQEEPYIPDLSIIAYLYTYAPFYPGFDFDQFFSLITEFGLEGQLKLNKLSFGQKKKVMLSFALASNARIVILDEPTNGLDIPSKSQFRKLITEAMLDQRIVIISTHQVRDMVNLIDPILILEDGKIIFNHSLEEIANALYFEVHHSMTEPQGVLYAERISGGYLSIRENTEGLHSSVDVEVLFNAILMKKDQIKSILEKYKSRIGQI
ncbi:MAG: ABC transporter ATP-binding protein [Saprospiraceae bacterium]|nr:ABC transporter ATP-binding protein [Saprospiraceae bacterium]